MSGEGWGEASGKVLEVKMGGCKTASIKKRMHLCECWRN